MLISFFSSSGQIYEGKIGGISNLEDIKIPEGIAIDNEGKILFTSEHTVKKYNPNGSPISQFGSLAQFFVARNVAVGPEGEIYVADYYPSRIHKYSKDGVFISYVAIGQVSYPAGIAVDKNGNIFIADLGNNRILKYSKTATFIKTWGSAGSGNNQFKSPMDVAVDSNGNVFVVDHENHRIQKFDNEGQYISQWGSQGTGDLMFNFPSGICTDISGNIYIADRSNHRIVKYSNAGSFQQKFGTVGSGNGQFANPRDVVVDNNGLMYVTDTDNNRIQILNSNGSFNSKWDSSPADGAFYSPGWVAFSPTSEIYIVDQYNHRIQKFSSNGQFILKWGNKGSGQGQFQTPRGVAVDSEGFVYVTDGNNRVQKFNSLGVYQTQWGTPGSGVGQFLQPRGIAIDKDDKIFVVDENNHRIQKFDVQGGHLNTYGTFGSNQGQFKYPGGIAFDKDGNFYISDQGNQRVQKFSSTGTFITEWGRQGGNNGEFNTPYGIAINSKQEVFVSDVFNTRIQQFSNSGVFQYKWGSFGFGNLQFGYPIGLAFNNKNQLYVCDQSNHRVLIYSFLSLDTFSPPNGQSGTSVTLTGTGFSTVSAENIVKFNNITATVTTSTPTLLTVTVPVGTTTGKISITRADFTVQSDTDFVITPFAISSVSPSLGNAGTTVTISGNDFSTIATENVVKFNGTEASVTAATNSSLTVTVPAGATTGKISVTRGALTAFSASEFLVLPLAISSFTPSEGSAGTSVTITGTGFSSTPVNNSISFSGTAATVTSSSATSLVATVPSGAGTGPISITINSVTASSSSDFAVLNAPVISNFTPTNGLVGTSVVINGSSFSTTASENTVKFNNTAAVVSSASAAALTVTVPAGATTGKISVTKSGLTSESTVEFLVLPFEISSFSPKVGNIGSSVTITGTGFSSVNSNNTVKFNNVDAVVTSSSPTSITATVPTGGGNGKISVTIAGVTRTSVDDFAVLSLSSFSPASGVVGSSVIISGTGFSSTAAQNTVKFNNIAASVTAASATSLTVSVPSGATTGKISVTRESVTVESTSEFLALPFQITDFTPKSGEAGTTVTISGSGFSSVNANNTVKFNDVNAVVTSSSPTSITATAPPSVSTGKISVTVGSTTTLSSEDFLVLNLMIINQPSYASNYFTIGQAGLNVSLTVNNSNEVSAVSFKSRGISAADNAVRSDNVAFSNSSNTITFQIPGSLFTDLIGLHTWFELTDIDGSIIESDKKYIYLTYPATSSLHNIPDLLFGKSAGNYQIIAIPYELKSTSLIDVFKSLGDYDNRKWRVFEFTNGEHREKPSAITPGKGYWFISKEEATINPGEGNTVAVTPDAPFSINLSKGWTLIGNPYNFTISWDDVLKYNNNPAGVGNLRQFKNGTVSNSNTLERFRGAFVKTENAINIKIPVINKNISGGRIQQHAAPIDAEQWTVGLSIDDGEFRNELFGIGMHPAANENKDIFDEEPFPILKGISSFDMAFHTPDNHALAADIVPTLKNFTWNASISADKPVTITWDNSFFGNNEKELIIENTNMVEVVNMRSSNELKLPEGNHLLKFHFGDMPYINDLLMESNSRIGNVYPNPIKKINEWISVSVSLPQGTNQVSLHIKNLLGQDIHHSAVEAYPGGRRNIQWQSDLSQFPSGIYLLQIDIIDAKGATSRITRKIILE